MIATLLAPYPHRIRCAGWRVGVPQEDTIPASHPTFHKNVTMGGGRAPVRAYTGCRGMADRESIKVMVQP